MNSPRYLLDANIILRFITGDHPDHLRRAQAVFQAAAANECRLLLTPWIIAEVVFTLQSFYQVPREETASHLLTVINSTGVETLDHDMLADGLNRFARTNISFVDCLLAAQSHALGIRPVSFDRDLDKFADIKRYEP